MTIINIPTDGLPPELIVLFRTVAHVKQIATDELIDVCTPLVEKATPEERQKKEKEILARLRGALSRWTELGLFDERERKVQLNEQLFGNRKEKLEILTERLPSFCRKLILQEEYCTPLWGEGGLTSDFARGIAWLLAQNIYKFPAAWSDVEGIQNAQTQGDNKLSQNDVRWNGLRFWARYLGFATGDSGSFQIDPTVAIRDELPLVFGKQQELSAKDFLSALSNQLPVLDNGVYRREVESSMNPAIWRKPDEGHLSMSLSFALRRLDLSGAIKLKSQADAGSSVRLIGQNYQTWIGFESVVWNGVRV